MVRSNIAKQLKCLGRVAVLLSRELNSNPIDLGRARRGDCESAPRATFSPAPGWPALEVAGAARRLDLFFAFLRIVAVPGLGAQAALRVLGEQGRRGAEFALG